MKNETNVETMKNYLKSENSLKHILKNRPNFGFGDVFKIGSKIPS